MPTAYGSVCSISTCSPRARPATSDRPRIGLDMLYTKEGRALRVDGDDLISRDGHVARLRDGYAFAPDGQYVGTVVGDRLIYRRTDSARRGGSYLRRATAGHAYADHAATAVAGDEPPI
jgi:hypothetical protein